MSYKLYIANEDLTKIFEENNDKITKKKIKEAIINSPEFETLLNETVETFNILKGKKKNRRDILTVDNLSLGYKTFPNREAKDDEIEICMWDNLHRTKFTIATFDYDKKNNCYILNSYSNRLDNRNIHWGTFGTLVQKGYEVLKYYMKNNKGD